MDEIGEVDEVDEIDEIDDEDEIDEVDETDDVDEIEKRRRERSHRGRRASQQRRCHHSPTGFLSQVAHLDKSARFRFCVCQSQPQLQVLRRQCCLGSPS